ncbi:MAG: energy transducer TonB [Thauera sp.]|jgi:protein TonB|nr:energy transducer TonB [Thauera sp.]
MTSAASPAASSLPKLVFALPATPRDGRPRATVSKPSRSSQRQQRSRDRLLRALALGVALACHALVFAFIFQLAERPVEIPPVSRITVALIEAPVETAPPAQEEPQPEPPAPEPEPPPPEPKPLPKPKPKPIPKPTPKPKPLPKPEPVLTESATALTSEERSSEPSTDEAVEPAPAPPPAPAPRANVSAAEPGPQLTAARFDAAYLNNPAPKYPPVSRRLREEGQVMLRVLVGVDGQPLRINLHTSSGSERLDKAAQEAVTRWRFVPAKRGDTTVEAWVQVPIVFKLTGN